MNFVPVRAETKRNVSFEVKCAHKKGLCRSKIT